ncbi:hypothetical protein Pla22_35480 [Rubripirellula amarantea]|uniref:Uncharacterized protein n=1 Tax=Rubripirellula amarantea TaxID=2527999 RepID=A0A5C5WKY6_9BACT|nr:hypothetical protein Pla22_35480 [Rubripirellula amarantea]
MLPENPIGCLNGSFLRLVRQCSFLSLYAMLRYKTAFCGGKRSVLSQAKVLSATSCHASRASEFRKAHSLCHAR